MTFENDQYVREWLASHWARAVNDESKPRRVAYNSNDESKPRRVAKRFDEAWWNEHRDMIGLHADM